MTEQDRGAAEQAVLFQNVGILLQTAFLQITSESTSDDGSPVPMEFFKIYILTIWGAGMNE